MHGENTHIQEVHLLGFSQAKLDDGISRLTAQKLDARAIMNAHGSDKPHSGDHMHVHPIVARVDGGRIVEYNMKEIIPKDWIIHPETGEIDKTRLPELDFKTPVGKDGVSIDNLKFEEIINTMGLSPGEAEQAWKLHTAHQIVHHTVLVAASDTFRALRDRDGTLQPGAEKYDLPPLSAGHVPVPTRKVEPALQA